jgi:hypothetical protein
MWEHPHVITFLPFSPPFRIVCVFRSRRGHQLFVGYCGRVLSVNPSITHITTFIGLEVVHL